MLREGFKKKLMEISINNDLRATKQILYDMGYLYHNGVEFCQKVIGAGLNLFWGHLNYPLGAFISKSQSPEG